jgi:hypothetical protein
VISLAVAALLAASFGVSQTAPRTKNSPPSAPLVPLDRAAPAVTLPYAQAFNAPPTGWTFTGKWHVRQSPQTTRVSDYILDKDLVQLPDDGTWPSAYEGTGVLVFSDDVVDTPEEGTFVAPWDTSFSVPGDGGISLMPVDGDAVLPQLDLTGLTTATMSIWTWFEIESVDPAPDQYDAMLVQASTDGTNFTTVGFAGPAVDYDGLPNQAATSGGFNVPGRWVRQVYDLSSLAGQNVWLRLRFQSNDALYNAFRGWFVDSLAITSNALPNCTIESVNPTTVAQEAPFLITGTNFVQGATVTVGGQPAVVQSTANTTLIEAVAPASLADGIYSVTVTSPNGSSCTLPNSLELKAGTVTDCTIEFSAPFCLSASDGSEQIVITGHGFQPGSVVVVNGVSVTPSYQDEHIVVFTLPALNTGFYEVFVRTPQGVQCTASGFLIVDPTICTLPPCAVNNISPTCVKPGQGVASRVTLDGSGFELNTSIFIDSQMATIVSQNSTQIVFEPPALSDGFYAVEVVSGGAFCLAPRVLQITSGSCSVATERTTWGRVKASYR